MTVKRITELTRSPRALQRREVFLRYKVIFCFWLTFSVILIHLHIYGKKNVHKQYFFSPQINHSLLLSLTMAGNVAIWLPKSKRKVKENGNEEGWELSNSGYLKFRIISRSFWGKFIVFGVSATVHYTYNCCVYSAGERCINVIIEALHEMNV